MVLIMANQRQATMNGGSDNPGIARFQAPSSHFAMSRYFGPHFGQFQVIGGNDESPEEAFESAEVFPRPTFLDAP
jgi:hypothetical protein